MGLTTIGEYVYARPAVAEKGYMDALLTVDTPGGHSSRPPSPHSGIGIVAEIIVALEANPFTPLLTKENPFRRVLECQAKYTPQEVEPWLRHALEKGEDDIGKRLADARGGETRYSMQTSQAVDIIRGGNKVNALPVTVTATVNYRIAPHDSLDIIKTHICHLRKKLGLGPADSFVDKLPSAIDVGAFLEDERGAGDPEFRRAAHLCQPRQAAHRDLDAVGDILLDLQRREARRLG